MSDSRGGRVYDLGSTGTLADAVDALGALADDPAVDVAGLVEACEALDLTQSAVRRARARINRRLAELVNPLAADGRPARRRSEIVTVTDQAGDSVAAEVSAGWRVKRSAYDDEGLLRAVLDSRRFDRGTGELIEETPVAKVLAVWAHPGREARTGALEARGLAIEDWCVTDYEPSVEIRR